LRIRDLADTWRGKGLGSGLLGDLQRRIRDLDVTTLVGDVLRSNETMLAFAHKAGFGIAARSGDPKVIRIVKNISVPGLPYEACAGRSMTMAA
jgi:GNAT superfamily N-acetyltransferase